MGVVKHKASMARKHCWRGGYLRHRGDVNILRVDGQFRFEIHVGSWRTGFGHVVSSKAYRSVAECEAAAADFVGKLTKSHRKRRIVVNRYT